MHISDDYFIYTEIKSIQKMVCDTATMILMISINAIFCPYGNNHPYTGYRHQNYSITTIIVVITLSNVIAITYIFVMIGYPTLNNSLTSNFQLLNRRR